MTYNPNWSTASPVGYTLTVQAAVLATVNDATTYYFGGVYLSMTATPDIMRVYIPKSGTIKRAALHSYSGTAGSNEAFSTYIRLNNTTDTEIASVATSANSRLFSNHGLSIAVVAGDYIEIKVITPTWGTNAASMRWNGSIYIE